MRIGAEVQQSDFRLRMVYAENGMQLTRRGIFGLLAGAAFDHERLLWKPGKKLFSIPKPLDCSRWRRLLEQGVYSINEVRAMAELTPLPDGDAHFVAASGEITKSQLEGLPFITVSLLGCQYVDTCENRHLPPAMRRPIFSRRSNRQ
jgi:hypothetical protein